jgi:hypothetical protein
LAKYASSGFTLAASSRNFFIARSSVTQAHQQNRPNSKMML